MNIKTKITALATTILLLFGFAGPTQAAPEKQESASTTQSVEIPVSAPTVSLPFDKVSVETFHDPVYAASTPVVRAPVVPQSAPTAPVQPQQTQSGSTTQTVPVKAATPRVTPAAPVVSRGSGSGAALLASARSQIGQIQDCTAMVERALGSIGIVTGDLAPNQFFRFGSVVDGPPAPGDIIISSGHVGIYSGGGMMVSGGFNGNQTVEHPISYVGGYSAVRVA